MGGNRRDLGIAGLDNMRMGYKFQMGMEMGGNLSEKCVPTHLYF